MDNTTDLRKEDQREKIIKFATADAIERHIIYQAVRIAKDGPENTEDPEAYNAAYQIYCQQTILDNRPGAEADNSPLLRETLAPLFGTAMDFDVMNSISTTLNQIFLPHRMSLAISRPISKRKLVKAYVHHRDAFEAAIPDDLRDCLCGFLSAAYTVGNFVPTPAGCNQPRGTGLTRDYADLALTCIRNWYLAGSGADHRSVYLELLLSGKRYPQQSEDEYLRERDILVRRYSRWLSSFGDGPEGWLASVNANFITPCLLEDNSPRPLWAGHIQAFEELTAGVVRRGTLRYAELAPLLKQTDSLLPRDSGQFFDFFTEAAKAIQVRSDLIASALQALEQER